jgi:hypothetical protein
MADKVVIPIKLKTGSEQQILSSLDMMIGEFAVATDTSRVWKWNGISHSFIGQCIVDVKTNVVTVSGIRGSFYFAEDTRELFIGNSLNEWLPLQYVTPSQLLTTSGDISARLSESVTLSGVGGIYTTKSGSVWYVGSQSQDPLVTVPAGHSVGHSSFSVSGTSVTHNLGTADHYLSVIPAGTGSFNEYEIASVGNVYIQLGLNDDVVWNTGGEMAEGIQFFWEATTASTYSILAASTQDLLTLSGSLLSYFESLVTTVSGQIPTVSLNGNIFGSGSFYYGGSTITHNLGTTSHYVSVTPADTMGFDELLIASIGEIYVQKGTDQDVVYHTGGDAVNGVKFDWEVIKHGLKMVE